MFIYRKQMTSIPKQIVNLFFPPTLPAAAEMTFKIAMEAVNQQRIARITKTAVFAISSIAATVCLVLSEASIVSWPILIPAITVSVLAGAIFYRLNSLDKRYTNGLDDKTRSQLAKSEMERIFLGKTPFSDKHVTKSLKNLNRFLGHEIFDKEAIERILMIKNEAHRNKAPKSIAEVGFEQLVPVAISHHIEWEEPGRFGLNSYQYALKVSWDGNPKTPIVINYQSQEIFSAAEEELQT